MNRRLKEALSSLDLNNLPHLWRDIQSAWALGAEACKEVLDKLKAFVDPR
jgi:hypothetical protein